MIDLNDNSAVAELARQQSIETGTKIYAVDSNGEDAVFIAGEMLRWAYIDDIEIIYSDDEAEKWSKILCGTKH